MLDYADARKLVIDALIEFMPDYWEKYASPEDVDVFLANYKNICEVSGQPVPSLKGEK